MSTVDTLQAMLHEADAKLAELELENARLRAIVAFSGKTTRVSLLKTRDTKACKGEWRAVKYSSSWDCTPCTRVAVLDSTPALAQGFEIQL